MFCGKQNIIISKVARIYIGLIYTLLGTDVYLVPGIIGPNRTYE